MNKFIKFAAIPLVLSACASRAPEARIATASQSNSAPAPQAKALSPEDREATVQISKTVVERCKIQDLPQDAPRFDYDRAALHARGRNVLDDVANCLLEGPLREDVITLVGRADPRGSESHNQSLGASRAEAARDYLALRGVPADRMRLLSRGEQGAQGSDEAGYAIDRRVDIELGDLKNSPILEGSMLQSETSRARKPVHNQAASYADTAEGGKPVGDQ
ncbi:MAG TPA: OmpA family protein [Polyangiaceae bacterium]|jgi:peptidoglycan-associated lipoprotein|nr:OmpA family protein [Polyangiaceae bacterium]